MSKPIDNFHLQIIEVKKLNDIFQYSQHVLTTGIDISGILRAQIVFSVSALDNYVHNIVLFGVASILRNKKPLPISFGKLTLGLDSVNMLMNDSEVIDTYALIEEKIKHNLSWKSFQHPDKIAEALRIICDKKIWNELENMMKIPAKSIKEQLQLIVKRRDSIAHEADFDIVNQCQYTINSGDVKTAVNFIISLVYMIDSIVLNYTYDGNKAHQEFIT